MKPGAVSVIIPVYNGKRFFKKAVQSILREKLPNTEIIVVDDGSTDGGPKTIRNLGVKIIHQKHKGQAAAQNRGLKEAKGEFVTFLDADDIIATGGLRKRVLWLMNCPKEQVVGAYPGQLIDAKGKVLCESPVEVISSAPKRLSMKYYEAGRYFPLVVWLFMFRKSFTDEIGTYDTQYKIAHDLDFNYRVLQKTDIFLLKTPVVHRRLHSNNLSLILEDGQVKFRKGAIEECKKINRRYGIPNDNRLAPWERRILSNK